jgi:glycosyltransferase involved in cell wall biosynthesis
VVKQLPGQPGIAERRSSEPRNGAAVGDPYRARPYDVIQKALIPAQTLQLSVVVPSCEPSPDLPGALRSLFAQTMGQLEVIVVADDSLRDALDRLALIDDPRLTVVAQAKPSLASARNTAIMLARAPLIAFCTAEDLWEPAKAERHLSVLASDPIAGLTFSYSSPAARGDQRRPAWLRLPHRDPTARDLILRNPIAGGSAVVMRREIFRLAGLFREELGPWAELEMWVRAAARTPYTIRRLPEVLQR